MVASCNNLGLIWFTYSNGNILLDENIENDIVELLSELTIW